MLLTAPNLSNNSIQDLQQQHQHQQPLPQQQQLHHRQLHQHRRRQRGLNASKTGAESETNRSLDLSGLVVPANPSLYCPASSRLDSASADLEINVGLNLDDVELDLDDLASLDSLDSLDSASAYSSVSARPVCSLQNPAVFEGFVDLGGSFGHFKNPPGPLPHIATAATRSDLMHGDGWLCQGQVPTKPVQTGRASHNRESSLSSLGSASAGPASPYSQTTSNPHIAVSDSPGDAFGSLGPHGLSGSDEFNYQLAKPFPHAQDASIFFPNYPTYQAPYPNTLASSRVKGDRSMLPPPDLSAGPIARSRPVSVASSVASDSPATPSTMDQHQHQQQQPEGDRRRRIVGLHTLPKLDRTMTDVYGDELYNPNFASSTVNSPSHHAAQMPISPNHEMFAQRLQAANSQHLSAVQSPVVSVSRGRSPFRNGSPLAPPPAPDFGSAMAGAPAHRAGFNTSQMGEGHDAEQDVMRRQMAQGVNATTPQTISPKDAMLEYEPGSSDTNFPLFPQPGTAGAGADASTELTEDQINKAVAEAVQAQAQGGAQGYDGMALDTAGFEYAAGLQVPQQYPFVSQASAPSVAPMPLGLSMTDMGQHCSSINGSAGGGSDINGTGSRSSSSCAGGGGGSRSPDVNSHHRPDDAARGTEGGTYTCTYHGCTQRFETPVLLQKHKREGHRQAHGLGGSGSGSTVVRRVDLGSGLVQLNTQAGPHRCDRINPSTGKSCNTIFSRPYDLTRHEDTIHNARKQKVRCDHCTEEKTFSRADALTRHYRVCHPDIPVPGKFRRRAMRGSPQAQAHY